MTLDKKKLALTDADLDGLSLAQVSCRQCSPFCSERQPVFVDGKPISVCMRNPAGREVVARWRDHVSESQPRNSKS